MVINYQIKGVKYVTPCPHSFGFITHGVWDCGSKKPVMVGCSICELDCPYNGGVDKFSKKCICLKS